MALAGQENIMPPQNEIVFPRSHDQDVSTSTSIGDAGELLNLNLTAIPG
jgi:hypothetical protein